MFTTNRRRPDDSNDNDRIILPRDWVLGQQIGVLAYALTQYDLDEIGDVTRRRRYLGARGELKNQLDEKIRRFDNSHVHVGLMPLSSLHLLAQYDKAKWSRIYETVTRGRWDDNGTPRPSQANAAKLIAHQVLFTDARPAAIAAASEAFLSRKFADVDENASLLRSIEEPLHTVRNATNRTSEIVGAIAELTSFFSGYSTSWNMVRNSLLDHVLTWPILVYRQTRSGRGISIGAVSLPIAVDLSFDGGKNTIIRTDKTAAHRQNLNLDDWKTGLRDASEKGKALWRAKNGNTGAWRSEVLDATTVFDFRIAQHILSGTGLDVQFSDRSMGPYYAQVVLAKAIGRHTGFTSAITGLIGEQRVIQKAVAPFAAPTALPPDEQHPEETDELEIPPVVEQQYEQEYVLDWRFSWAGEVSKKRKYVYGSYKFDRLVLPLSKRRKSAHDSLEESTSYVETNHCNYLSELADCVQVGGWRQFRYVRCPDINHTIHRHHDELPAVDSKKVAQCLSTLRSNAEPVLTLPPEISAADLLSSLREINFVRRVNDSRPAPTLSWAVIRTADKEQDTRFWHMVWRVLGAPRELFNRFKLAQTPREAAVHLAQALNCMEPTEKDRGERAPDLLVLIGTKNQYLTGGKEVSLARPLAYEFVISELRKCHIAPVVSPKLRDFIGWTRLIAVEAGEEVGKEAAISTELPSALQELIRRHRIYRFGFTQQMASVMMRDTEVSPGEIRSSLQELCRENVLTYGGGWYRIRRLPDDIAERYRIKNPGELARRHFAAALSFAPYMLTWPVPGLNIASALLPENVREALYHFERTVTYATKCGNLELATRARLAMQKISRFFEIQTWGVITRLSRKRADMPLEEVYVMAKEMLAELEDARITPLPTVLTTVARAGTQWWRELRKEGANGERAHALKCEIVGIYERACKLAEEDRRFGSEMRLHVWTDYAVFLRQFGNSTEENERKTDLDELIGTLIESGAPALWPNQSWFEFAGDDEQEHAAAQRCYAQGIKYVPNYEANYVKSVGSLLLSGHDKDAVSAYVKEFGREKMAKIMERIAFSKSYHFNILGQEWVFARWRAGRDFLRQESESKGSAPRTGPGSQFDVVGG